MSAPHEKYRRLIEAATALPPLATAVAHPCDENAFSDAVHWISQTSDANPIVNVRRTVRTRFAAFAGHWRGKVRCTHYGIRKIGNRMSALAGVEPRRGEFS